MTVTIYSTTICAACHSLTQWLDSVGQKYDKKIVDEDGDAMAEFMTVNEGMVGVPFSVVTADDGTQTKISGFDQGKFKSALGL